MGFDDDSRRAESNVSSPTFGELDQHPRTPRPADWRRSETARKFAQATSSTFRARAVDVDTINGVAHAFVNVLNKVLSVEAGKAENVK